MRATKFDPERTNNAQHARPNGPGEVDEPDQPAAVQPPRGAPSAAPEPRYRSAAPPPPAPSRPEPPRPEPRRRPELVRPEPPRPESLREEAARREFPRQETARPEPARPDFIRREPVRPEPARPDFIRREPVRPEPARPDFIRREPVRPEPARPDFIRREPMRPEPARPDFIRREPMRPEPARPDFIRQEPLRPEPARPDFIRQQPVRPEPAPDFIRQEPVRPELMRPEPLRPAPQYRSTAPTAPSWYRPEPDTPASAPPKEPVYRSTAPIEEARFAPPLTEGRPAEPPRYVQPPPQQLAAPVEAPLAPRSPAPLRPAAPSLPAPGFARGLPAPAPPAPAPPVVTDPFPTPAPHATPQPLPTAQFGAGLPAPAPAAPPRLVAPVASAASAAPALRPVRPRPIGPLEIDRVRYEDLPAILDLVNADLLAGQPTCGRHELEMAMRGESSIDSSWWRELSDVRVAVARRGGSVVGAASYATAAADHSGWLLWLHAREERQVVGALIDHAIAELGGSSHLYAFWIATALSLGVEALPVEQQPVTHELLTSRGLMGRDSWRYLVLPMERFALDDRAEDVAAVQSIAGPGEIPAWELVVGDREEPAASAEIALAGEGCGVLRWIDVEPAQRGRGVGRRLLRQALRFLALRGAQTVAAFVDHADPRERDPSASLRMLGSAGFQEVDRLWSYESPRRRR